MATLVGCLPALKNMQRAMEVLPQVSPPPPGCRSCGNSTSLVPAGPPGLRPCVLPTPPIT